MRWLRPGGGSGIKREQSHVHCPALSPKLPKTCSDIHGQYSVLRLQFHCGAFPPKAKYLFMEGYVKYPENFFLLRGNPSSEPPSNRIYGVYKECKPRYSLKPWKTFIDCLPTLPSSTTRYSAATGDFLRIRSQCSRSRASWDQQTSQIRCSNVISRSD
ncbi:hypothetical protein HPB48_022549 [Haemaphysalis longicornis]|uniref:protein-serine/threonine phosphatase n=1 Tax=Haemaphysalis longicornis TaxID=44386 RepID=A0A9J6FTH6_HAELO|nr:hypothetical protein HPB48_022549 [Haemaphysalis longicornis]